MRKTDMAVTDKVKRKKNSEVAVGSAGRFFCNTPVKSEYRIDTIITRRYKKQTVARTNGH